MHMIFKPLGPLLTWGRVVPRNKQRMRKLAYVRIKSSQDTYLYVHNFDPSTHRRERWNGSLRQLVGARSKVL